MKRKIAIIAHGLANGGAERVASILANYFSKSGYNVLFIAAYSAKKEYKLLDDVEYTYINTLKKKSFGRLIDRNIKIYRKLRQYNADSIFSFIVNETILSILHKLPIIYSLRIDPNVTKNWIDRVLREYAYLKSKKVVFQTKGAQAYFSYKIKEKSIIIPNPIYTNKLPLWSDHIHNKIFVTACRLTEQKNLPMMMQAFYKFHLEFPEYELHIYGEGELKEKLQSIIKKLDAVDYIILKGRSTKIYDIMAESYGFILTSNYEGLSNSMLEALAIGTPCICTDCPPGGAREYIRHMENGLLVPCGSPEATYEALKTLATDSSICNKFSKNSLKYRVILNADNICSQWENIILKIN